MPRYKILIEFDGTVYRGWQKQPNAHTIEEELEDALSQILREKIDVIGQGRTDSGVHAEAQAAHFDVSQAVDSGDLLYALLGVLPRNIAVWKMQEVPDHFHARFDATARQYRYQIVTRPSPLLFRTAAFVPHNLDWKAIQKCAAMIKGTHDFKGFCKTNNDQPNTVCTVDQSALEKDDHVIRYRIRANRFVRNMVRRLVGSMIQVGKGKWTVKQFEHTLYQPTEETTSHGAAAKGLILEKVEY